MAVDHIPAADGKVLVLGGFDQEQIFHLREFRWILSSQIVRLAPIFIDVVQLPLVC